MNRSMKSSLSILAGAGIGVTMMYLLDPKEGERRRRKVTEGAKFAAAGAGELAHGAMDRLSHLEPGTWASKARGAAAALGDHVQSALSAATSAAKSSAKGLVDDGSDAIETAQRKLAEIRDDLYARAEDAVDSASDRASDAKHRVNIALGREQEHHYVGQTMCALGSLGLGAGLLYLFDPRLGRSRRQWIAGTSSRWIAETGEFFHRTGRHFAGRMRGQYANARGRFSNEPLGNEQLTARIRAALGRVTSLAGVEVIANEGHITLRGQTEESAITKLGNSVLGMRGVRGLDNQLRAAAAK